MNIKRVFYLYYYVRLTSCSEDKAIKIYNVTNNYHCDITIAAFSDETREGHELCVTYINELRNKHLISSNIL